MGSGQVIKWVLIGAFYGKRAFAEQMLREIAKRYRILVETSPAAIALTDLHSNFIMVNKQAALLHGFESEEEMLASGKNGFDFFLAKDRQRAMEGIKTIIEKGILNRELGIFSFSVFFTNKRDV